jgi:restriction endonuclease Mrr
MSIDITFHYPPELMNLLINVIPTLNRSKKDVFLFFKGAGVSEAHMCVPHQQWQQNPDGINKYEIVRQLLTKINEQGETCLRERREILKRVVEFENFSVCWENDHLKAKGLVAEIRDLVNVKDSFTRMNLERDRERQQRLEKEQAEKEALRQRLEVIEKVKQDLYRLFSLTNPQARGKALEDVLNRLFHAFDIGVREAFTLVGDSGEGTIEQIDGVVEIDGHIYFVEMKWWNSPLGVPEISRHLVRVYHRAESRAIIISASHFTDPAVATCKDALQQKVVVLCTLEEIVMLLEHQEDLKTFLQKKVQAAIIEKNPFCQPFLAKI